MFRYENSFYVLLTLIMANKITFLNCQKLLTSTFSTLKQIIRLIRSLCYQQILFFSFQPLQQPPPPWLPAHRRWFDVRSDRRRRKNRKRSTRRSGASRTSSSSRTALTFRWSEKFWRYQRFVFYVFKRIKRLHYLKCLCKLLQYL